MLSPGRLRLLEVDSKFAKMTLNSSFLAVGVLRKTTAKNGCANLRGGGGCLPPLPAVGRKVPPYLFAPSLSISQPRDPAASLLQVELVPRGQPPSKCWWYVW